MIDIHLIDSNHIDAFNYIGVLKTQLNLPETVVASKRRKNTKIANILLKNRRHIYLQVVIRYGTFFSRLLGKKNFIVTFYPADKPKKGRELWKR